MFNKINFEIKMVTSYYALKKSVNNGFLDYFKAIF